MASRAGAAASLLLLLLLSCFGATDGEYASQNLSTFVDTLVAEYDREVLPAARTLVQLVLDVRHAAVYDSAATMRMLADLQMSWNEPRLTWNATQWEGDTVLVPLERIWAPDVALVSAGGAVEGGAGAGLRARLTAAGGVAAVLRLDLSVPLSLELRDWPKDVQQATFTFASRAHTDDELEIVISDNKSSIVVECGAWEVTSVVGALSSWRRGEEAATGAVTWTVVAARRGAAQAAAATAVLGAAVLLLMAAAALPFPQRPPLAACAAFLAAMWLITAIFHVPAAGSTPRVVCVMCAVCVCAAACGAAAAITTRVARRASPPALALRALLSRVSAVYALAPDPESVSGSKSGAWAALAHLLDAFVVCALTLTLLVLVAVHVFS